jgi:LCP family protein required for cell wall assembly
MVTQDTQPGRTAFSQEQTSPRRRTPLPLILVSGVLAVMVIACAACSLSVMLLGPERVLAFRDQLLGDTPEERRQAVAQVVELVIHGGESAWPIPNDGRLTLLLMGVDRRAQPGDIPARSDAITLITIDPASKTAAMLSIPRDLYVPIAGLDRVDRINTAYFFGDAQRLPGGGAQTARDTIALNLGIPIDRHFIINFEGFKQAIDALGGIDVDVPATIVDDQYPRDDFGVERLVIPAGLTHMDGELALKYVRTRHADSDLGRLRRQQQVMLAVRDKALSLGALSHLPELVAAVDQSYQTDLSGRDGEHRQSVERNPARPYCHVSHRRIDDTTVEHAERRQRVDPDPRGDCAAGDGFSRPAVPCRSRAVNVSAYDARTTTPPTWGRYCLPRVGLNRVGQRERFQPARCRDVAPTSKDFIAGLMSR